VEADGKAGEEIVGRLRLDVRALTLLYESDAELRPVVERAFTESQDRYVMRFVELLQRRKKEEAEGGNVPLAIGEIVLAAVLTILGLAAFVPSMAGLSTPQEWLGYLSKLVGPSTSPVYEAAPLIDFLFSALLLLGAFYSLRRAAKVLKEAGLVTEQGRN
jgi:hypothetical protein